MSDIGPALLLTLFVGLKLTGYIDWSWWWVVSPIWMPFVIAFVLMGGVYILTKAKIE